MEKLNIDKIKVSLQEILNKSHTLPEKKILRVKAYGARPVIEMACPICGDSDKITQKKRGNLWLNNLFYVCFNCGSKMGYVKLLDEFGVGIDLDDKIKIYEHIDKYEKNTTYNNKDYDLSKLDKIMDVEEVIKCYNDRKDEIFDFKPIEKNSQVYQYLKYTRKLTNIDNIYEGIYKISDKWFEPVMIIMNKYDDKLLGFQLRNLKDEKRKRLYKIYDFQSVYNYVNDEPIDDEKALPYNKLSHLYNILNVDFYNNITVFEGYIDSTFFPNSIGTTGVDTDYGFLLETDELDVRFFYDNDNVGTKKSIEKMKEGYSVFLWDKLFKDISKGDYKKEYQLKNKIKDLNDLAKITKGDVFDKFKLNDYFSIDEFDKIYLPIFKKY